MFWRDHRDGWFLEAGTYITAVKKSYHLSSGHDPSEIAWREDTYMFKKAKQSKNKTAAYEILVVEDCEIPAEADCEIPAEEDYGIPVEADCEPRFAARDEIPVAGGKLRHYYYRPLEFVALL
jgi:hypothetical protein